MKIKKEYLKSLIRQKSLKQREVAFEIGVSPQDFNNWMFRGVFPHFDKLQEVARLLGVPTATLTTEKLILERDGNTNYKNQFGDPDGDAVPYYDLDTPSILSFLKQSLHDFIPADHVYIPALSADFVIPYYGKEMDPVISSGDLIALRRIEDLSFFNYGSIYLISTEEHVIIRTVKAGTKKNHLVLAAESPNADDIEIPLKKVTATYLLVSVIKRQVI